ncbi:phosphoenolpyruvate--protein phosphotransferase [Rhodohalobacter halophilus]|uniref:phosphoenolpyruvate--protein phosphotransferase n=1 Tax=Rhodohalobacter halophilus TaxID=1812810 RepID=UPI00159F350F|nr:phosphoenolpyruvate--protein phosphotransferase [Rhodohalobacter halophilus]
MRSRIELTGIPASRGIGLGNAYILEDNTEDVSPEKIQTNEVEGHLDRFRRSINYLREKFERLKKSESGEVAEILDAQIETLKDPELNKSIQHKIKNELYRSEYAIYSTFNEYIHVMENADSEWLNDRTIDLIAIRDQLIDIVRNRRRETEVTENSVIFASNISPTKMIELSRQNIAGVVMEKGGLTSHAVILSQSLDIPCVINVKWNRKKLLKGEEVFVDGDTGKVIIRPDERESRYYRDRKEEQERLYQESLKIIDQPSETRCGSPFHLQANVEFLEELPRIEKHGAHGVGLLRTETILFQKTGFDVEAQLKFYREVVQASGGSEVTIRLFDAGGDKLIGDSDLEANPFLGWRGIRMLLDRQDLLDNQLEAIYRLSGEFPGQIKMLVPMISCMSELNKLKKAAENIRTKLEKGSVNIDSELPIGIMIEVPSAALLAEQFAENVDFFSIGTNDLTQYTLAVDRGNERISDLFQPNHPAVWKLIQMTKVGADKHGVPVAVCGEMASKPKEAACLIGMGINSLSMTTSALPAVKAFLCDHTLDEMQLLADSVLSANSPLEAEKLLNQFV